MATQPPTRRTAEEYLALERASGERHEYLGGEVFAMGGASEAHNLIVANLVREFGQQLKRKPCKVYASDMRVKVAASGLYTYPDVVVVCGDARFDDAQRDTLVNPTAICEVLSPSTESYDRGRGEKFEHYRKLDTLKEVLLFAQDRRHVEHYTHQADDRWLLAEWSAAGDVLRLESVGCALALGEVYDKVEV